MAFYMSISNSCSKQYSDLVPKGVHENRTRGVENKVDTLKLVVFLECAQCWERFLKSKR